LVDEARIRKGGLRILVERLQVRMGRRCVEVEVALLHGLAVVALGRSEAEEALLQDRIALVPKGYREADEAAVVGEAEEAVLTPAISAAPRMVVREVSPRVALRGVILADGSPLALRKVRAP